MRFAFSDDQLELKRMLRELLAKDCPMSRVRQVMYQQPGYDAALWARLSAELGLTALLIDEEHGGAGFGWVELCAVMEELGRSLAPVPLLSTSLAAQLLRSAGSAEQRACWLPQLASGEIWGSVALEAAGPGADAQPFQFREVSGEFELRGQITRWVDGHAAGLLIAPATDRSGQSSLFLIDASAHKAALRRERQPSLDATRALGSVTLDRCVLPANALLATDAGAALEGLRELACIALGAEQVGTAEACLEQAVEYAKTREQFGRAIGSFQAIKHRCADMLLRLESARSAAYYAAWAASTRAPDTAELSHLCASYCAEACFECAASNIQIHGGIGFTWEHDAHLYFKRARATESWLGSPASHREAVAQLWLDGARA